MRRYTYIIVAITISLCAQLQAQSIGQNRHYTRGLELYAAQRYAAAAAELRKAETNDQNQAHLMEIEYLMAMCAVETADGRAENLLAEFLAKYPNSIYNNDIHMANAELSYEKGNYASAEKSFLLVNPYELSRERQNRYNFKIGHTLFNLNKDDNAYSYLRQVDASSDYAPHSTYYISYIDYVKGNYETAKKGFTTLLANAAYTPIIPFYLLQIEFLQNNYNYVVEHGDKLAAAAQSPRDAEILRLLAESWYHLKDYARTLAYLDGYTSKGGVMRREELYISGYSSYMMRDYRAAADALAQVCAIDDELSQNASYHLADSYLKLGDKLSAIKSFSIASAGDYSATIKEDALFNYGKLQYELGGGVFNEAINILSRYINEYPSSTRVDQAREYLLAAYYNSRNYEAAYEAIKLMPNPDNNVKTAYQKISYFRALEYMTEGDIDMADKLLSLSMRNKFNPKYTALTNFWQGEILVKRGLYREAIPLFASYIKLAPQSEPEHAMALYNLAYCNFNLKNWAEATSYFNRFLPLYATKDSYTADTYNRLGDIAYAERGFWRAIEQYDNAIKQGTPEQYYAAFQRANMLGMVDRPQRKIESLQQIIAGDRGDYVDEALYELGRAYTYQEQFKEAASTLKNYIAKYPNSPQTLTAISDLGLIYQNLGDRNQALQYYKMVVTKSPHSTQGRDALAGIRGIYVDINDVDAYYSFVASAGVETNQIAVERDSLNFAAAEKIYLGGNSSRGLTSMNTYLKNYPRGTYRAAALYYAGECAQREGDKTQAKRLFAELTQMYYTEFTVRGLERLSAMLYENKEYREAESTYKKLSETATNPTVIAAALQGAINSSVALGDTQNIIATSNYVLASPFADDAVSRTARFAKANALKKEGNTEESIAIYKRLGAESATAIGAESSYNVIEYTFGTGELKRTEQLIMTLSDGNSPHTYWVGRAFLVLGDLYSKKGDAFQARATYQSIVDGYTPTDDGVVEQAKEKIKTLK